MAQRVQHLVRNEVTHNSPDIQVPGLFSLTERTYGVMPHRSAHLYLFDKLEFTHIHMSSISTGHL